MSDLTVKIKGDASGFQKEWAKVQGTVSNTLSGGGLGVSSMVGGILGGLSIGALVNEIKSLVDELDNIGDASKTFGLTAKEFQVISYAAKKVGADANDVGVAFKKMNSMIYDATQGNQQAGAAFYYLGLNAEKLSKMKMDQKFKIIAEALAKQENPTIREALAQDMLGKSYQRVLQVMKELPNALSEAEKFGLIFDDEKIRQAEEIADALLRIGIVVKKGFVDTGALKEIENLIKAAESLLLLLEKFKKFTGVSISEAVGSGAKSAVTSAMPTLGAGDTAIKILSGLRDKLMGDSENKKGTTEEKQKNSGLSVPGGYKLEIPTDISEAMGRFKDNVAGAAPAILGAAIPGSGAISGGIDVLTQILNVLNGRLPGGASTGEVIK